MKFLGSLSLSLLAFSATSWVAASSSPDSVSLHYRAQALDEPTGLHMRKLRRSNLHPRQQNIVDEAATNPVQAANDAAALPGVAGNTNGNDLAAGDLVQGDSDEGQLPWNSAVPFVANANAAGDPTNGWQALPQMDGFTLNRSLVITEGAIQVSHAHDCC